MKGLIRNGAVALAVAAMAGGIAFSGAQVSAQDKQAVVKERQALMKDNGRSMGQIARYLKAGKGTPKTVAAAATHIKANAGKIVALFPAGTSLDDMKGSNRAKAAIWQKKDQFQTDAQILAEKAEAVVAAAGTGDKGKIAAAFGDLNRGGCINCHRAFRGPKPKN